MGLLDKLRGTDEGVRAPARAIVAAAMPLTGPEVKAVNRGRQYATTSEWQNEAWYYFDAVGDLRAPLIWIANAVSQADVHATELDETGKPTGPTADTRAQAVAAQVLGGPSQRPGLLRLIALCWQCVGETWVIIRPQNGGKPDQWLALSGNKVKARGETWSYTDPFTGADVILNGRTDRMIRAWSPHPNDQCKADSAVRPALPILREIEKASQNIIARLESRIASNGIGLMADELDYPKGDFDTVGGAVMDFFMSAAEANLKNPGQASAQVPLILNAPGELIANGGAFAHVDISTEFDGQVVELRDNGRERLAATLDMPKSVATQDQAEANHWSAWQVEESTYKIFIEPLLKSIGDVITEHWFRPALIALGFTPEQADRFELGWDTTAIVARPDDTENLRDLHDRVLISDEYMLTENGVPEDAKPSDEERTRRILEKIVIGAPTLLADPAVAEALGLDIEVQPAAAGVDATVTPGGELEPPEPAPAVRALPSTQGQEPTPADVPEGLVAAAELIVYDALSRAGGRLLTNQNRGQFKSTRREELYREVPYERTPERVHALMEGSFQFADKAGARLGVDGERLSLTLSSYVYGVLRARAPYDQRELKWALRELM